MVGIDSDVFYIDQECMNSTSSGKDRLDVESCKVVGLRCG